MRVHARAHVCVWVRAGSLRAQLACLSGKQSLYLLPDIFRQCIEYMANSLLIGQHSHGK